MHLNPSLKHFDLEVAQHFDDTNKKSLESLKMKQKVKKLTFLGLKLISLLIKMKSEKKNYRTKLNSV